MLLLLAAIGVITSGGTVTPGTGDINLPAGQTAVAKPSTASAGTGTGIPATAVAWTLPFDPSNRRPYAMDWAAILGDQKIIAIETITVSPLGVSLGVGVDDGADDIRRAPMIDTEGQKLQIWPRVADSFKSNAAFSYPGTKIGISALIRTDADPYEEIELTWVLTVAQG